MNDLKILTALIVASLPPAGHAEARHLDSLSAGLAKKEAHEATREIRQDRLPSCKGCEERLKKPMGDCTGAGKRGRCADCPPTFQK